jgi:hypothetical protein
MKAKAPAVVLTIGAAAGMAAAYRLLLRRRCLTWGTEADEADRRMPGDALLPDAPLVTTRAVTIDAPPAAVWPWLVQMGPGRGGAYTYDWIENLFGLDMHSADTILPEFQDLKPGDTMQLGATGPRMRVELLDPDQALAFQSDDGAWVWEFELRPAGGGQTRLISRNRVDDPRRGPLARAVMRYVMEPGSLIMERKMLLGIKARAERFAEAGR